MGYRDCAVPSHPWINFSFRAQHQVLPHHWALLGECASKIQHIIGTPLMPRVAESMSKTYMSRGILGTAAIEGNTLSQEQVQMHLEGTLQLPPSQQYLADEINNLQAALDRVAETISEPTRTELTEAEIKEFNRLILQGLPSKPGVTPGVYAEAQHGVANYRAPSPTNIRKLMPCFIEWINESEWKSEFSSPFVVPILRAILAHLYLAWIHPFGDGNGRTARMVELDLLVRAGIPAISCHLLSTHYNKTRTEYYRVLAATSATKKGDPSIFIGYALQGFVDGLRQQIEEVKIQHREIVWRDYVHDRFRDFEETAKYVRLRKIAMDLAQHKEPVPKTRFRKLSARVEAAYDGRTIKTVSRDVKELTRLGLIRRTGNGYVAAIEQLNAFLPPIREAERDQRAA